MLIAKLVLLLMLQTPAQTPAPGRTIVVGLRNGQQLVVQDPQFTGFIDGHNGDALLMYREGDFHGLIPLKSVCHIEFGAYRKGEPFAMTITLTSGQTLQVHSEGSNYISLRGKTDVGFVTIKHPDPISAPVKLTTHKADREKDLTIQYLEIPAS